MTARLLFAAAMLIALPATSWPQALTNVTSLRVAYNTRKNTVKPQGELKAQIEALDAQIAEASRLGRTGELRRLLAKGNTLPAGRPWTEAPAHDTAPVLHTR